MLKWMGKFLEVLALLFESLYAWTSAQILSVLRKLLIIRAVAQPG